MHRRLRFRAARRHDHAFAGRQAIRLDHHGRRVIAQIGEGAGGVVKYRGRGGWDAVLEQHLLGVDLRSLQPRAVPFRAVGRDPGGGERVDQPEGKRHLGADHDELHLAGKVVGRHGKTVRLQRDAAIAGRGDHPRAGGRREAGAHQRVFAPAGPDDQDRGGKLAGHVEGRKSKVKSRRSNQKTGRGWGDGIRQSAGPASSNFRSSCKRQQGGAR